MASNRQIIHYDKEGCLYFRLNVYNVYNILHVLSHILHGYDRNSAQADLPLEE